MTPTAPRRRPTRSVAAATLLALALATGCSTPEERAASAIATRPSMEATVARYEEMQTRIRAEVDAVLGPRPWRDAGNADLSACGPAGIGAERRVLPMWTFAGAVPDAQWLRVRDAVTSVAAGYGFTGGGAAADAATSRNLALTDPALEASISVGTQVDTVMQVTTGCHVPIEGRPA